MYLALRKAPEQASGLHLHLTAHATLILVGVAALYFVAYLISLRIHPFRKCHWCGGSGKVSGAIFTWSTRRCGKCIDGLVPRLGTLLFAGGGVRQAQ